jgi:hypothetical protein
MSTSPSTAASRLLPERIARTRTIRYSLNGQLHSATVEIAVNIDELASRYGAQAACNKSRHARAVCGAIVVLAHDIKAVQP